MTEHSGRKSDGLREGGPSRRMLVRAVASTVALVTVYYLLPLDRSSTDSAVTMLAIGLLLFIGLVLYQVRSIITSPFPAVRAVEALATSVPLFLLLFAATYVVMARVSADNFSQLLTAPTRCTSRSRCSRQSGSATSRQQARRRGCCSPGR